VISQTRWLRLLSKWKTFLPRSLLPSITRVPVRTSRRPRVMPNSCGHGRLRGCQYFFANISTHSSPDFLTVHRLLLLSMGLTIFPRLLLFISDTARATERRTALTPLESFLALHFGIWLAAISLALVFNVCIPHLCFFVANK
jgi:hypothetical protein